MAKKKAAAKAKTVTSGRKKHAREKKKSAARSDVSPATLIANFVTEFTRIMARGIPDSFKLDNFEAGRAILDCPPERRIEVVHELMSRSPDEYWEGQAVAWLKSLMLKRKLPYSEADILKFAELLGGEYQTYLGPDATLIGHIERYARQNPPPEAVIVLLKEAIDDNRGAWVDSRKAIMRLRALIGDTTEVRLRRGEAWSDAAIADLKAMKEKARSAWHALLVHCKSADGGRPTAKWKETGQGLLAPITTDDFKSRLLSWFPLVSRPPADETEVAEHRPRADTRLNSENVSVLKGLVWCCTMRNDAEIIRALTPLAMTAYKKVPGVGPRAVALGNACVYALGEVPGTEGVAQLAILKVRVKLKTAQKGIEKALVTTAEREGVPRDELEEMSVPAYGLSEVGLRSEQLGDVRVDLTLTGRKVELCWFKADGRQVKTVPASVKRDFAEDLKELRQAAKDIEKMIPAQAARIEQTYLQQKEWDFPVWCERYRDHPLVGALSRALIWQFRLGRRKASAVYLDGKFIHSDDKPVGWIDEETRVALWHPIGEDATKITAWRDWLLEHEIRQPFKQAHREVYILTDAERNTRVYSNRFAAHVLKQHQFNALCSARGWWNTLRLMVDDDYPPAHIELPHFGLRAEYWIEGAGDDYEQDTNETGTYRYLVTDQVRFYRSDAAMNRAHASGGGYAASQSGDVEDEPVPVEEIPALAFSEVMRDVDLFVGVSSVGNDPNWYDGGPEGRYREYWQSYSFGALGATAETRKAVLERLIPRLKVADRCSFSDRFLIVRGDIRTYKIHLGSGNILMEPNDEYLCIVARQSVKGADRVFLPFEGDNTMSIVLSKALLLADDRKIKDPIITSQILRK